MNRLLRYIHLAAVRIALLVLCLVAFSTDCWGISKAKCVVNVSSAYPGGGVFVSDATTNSPSYASSSEKETQVGGTFATGQTHHFYLYAQPNSGYIFKGWYSEDACTSLNSTDSPWHTTIKGNTLVGNATETYYAKFVKIYNSSVTVVASAGGTARVNGNASASTTGSESQSHSYNLTAVPDEGYVFSGWYSDANHTILVSANASYTHTITATHGQANVQTLYALFSNKLSPNISGEAKSLTVGTTMDAGFSFTNVSNAKPVASSNGSNFYFSITHNVGSAQLNPDHPQEVIAYDADKNKITAYNAGTATITFTQNETNEYFAASKSFTITVSKRSNALSIQGYPGSTVTIPFGKQCAVISSNNATRPAINISQTAGNNSALCSIDGGTPYIRTLFQAGQAKFDVSQAEDYMYLLATATLTVNVEQTAEETAYVLYELAEKKLGTNEEGTGMKLSGPGDKLTFVAWKSANTALEGLHIQYSTNGGNSYSDIDSPSFGLSNDERNFEYTVPEGTTHIRFKTSGSSYTKHYKDVKVTRKTYLNATPDAFTLNVYEGASGQDAFTVDWSIANGGELKVYNDNAADFTVSPTAFGNGNNADGKTTVTVTYTGDKDHSHSEANLIIYNDVYMKRVTVTGNTMWKAVSERYRIKAGEEYVTAGAGMKAGGKHLAQAFVFNELEPNTFGVTYGDGQTLYESATTEKTGGVWYVKDGGNTVGAISDDAEKYDCSMVVTGAEWGTFIAPYSVVMPDGVTAYTLTDKRVCDKVILEKVDGSTLTANTPYILKSATAIERQYSDYGTATADEYAGGGRLTGTFIDHTTAKGEYVLQQHTSGTGFFIVDDITPTVSSSRCYIAATGQTRAKGYLLSEDNTAMPVIDNDNTPIYTISGIRVTAPMKSGIYIKNGKTLLIKQ